MGPTPDLTDPVWLTSVFSHIDDIVENRQDRLDPGDERELVRFIVSGGSARDAVMYVIIHVGDIDAIVNSANGVYTTAQQAWISNLLNEYVRGRNESSRHNRVVRGIDWLDRLYDQARGISDGDINVVLALVSIRSIQAWLLWSIGDVEHARQAVTSLNLFVPPEQYGIERDDFRLAALVADCINGDVDPHEV